MVRQTDHHYRMVCDGAGFRPAMHLRCGLRGRDAAGAREFLSELYAGAAAVTQLYRLALVHVPGQRPDQQHPGWNDYLQPSERAGPGARSWRRDRSHATYDHQRVRSWLCRGNFQLDSPEHSQRPACRHERPANGCAGGRSAGTISEWTFWLERSGCQPVDVLRRSLPERNRNHQPAEHERSDNSMRRCF